jgi:hypothetical protein
LLATIWSFLGRPAPIGALLALVAMGLLAFHFLDPGGGDAGDAEALFPPAEFLYLDSSRIGDYLAELEGGRTGAEHRSTKKTSEASGEGSVGGFKVGASAQREDIAESTLTETAVSEMDRLFKDLKDNTVRGVSVHQVRLDSPKELKGLREGWLVRFPTHRLLSPGYIRPYVVVRQTATLAALFPGVGTEPSVDEAAPQRRRAESFVRQVGPDPRMTFAIAPPGTDRHKCSLRILMPMRYSGLTQERSLLEKGVDKFTGGHLTVVGKVIRVFPEDQKGPQCDGRQPPHPRPRYTDFATREIWKNPIEGASNYLIEHVSHNCVVESVEDGRPLRGRECFLSRLEEQTRLYGPGAVILPLAVYK